MNDNSSLNDRLKRYSAALYEQLQKRLQNGSNGLADLRIGLWGTTGSGKTTYFARLYQALAQSPDWIVERNAEADAYLRPILSELQRGNLPLPNRQQDDLKIYEYRLSGETKAFKGVNVRLSFIDAPGEFYENPVQGANKIENRMDVLDYLSSCHGIIFLLDPDRDPKEKKLETLLDELMVEFQQRSQRQDRSVSAKRLEQHMAFCVTKVDQGLLWEEAKNPEAQFKRVAGKGIYRELQNNYCFKDRYKFYPVSAIGRYQEGEEWVPVINYPTDSDRPSINNPQATSQNQSDSILSTNSFPDMWDMFPPLFSESANESAPDEKPTEASPDPFNANGNSEDDPYKRWQLPESQQPPEPPQRSSFDEDKDPMPVNVIDPIEWLIQNIRAIPPKLNLPSPIKQERF